MTEDKKNTVQQDDSSLDSSDSEVEEVTKMTDEDVSIFSTRLSKLEENFEGLKNSNESVDQKLNSLFESSKAFEKKYYRQT